ncbi:hypothetical protein [Mycobacterium terramassiliense]|uniref:hypothetical protein n=1 Tax=Mycobacterium terramassiliense TaxID=1841859 RepID=UPI0012FF7E35|nr:hypothetical protein [Mycobacterium terramassiliense]
MKAADQQRLAVVGAVSMTRVEKVAGDTPVNVRGRQMASIRRKSSTFIAAPA